MKFDFDIVIWPPRP